MKLLKYFFYDLWFMLRVFKDFVLGLFKLKLAREYITIYGSARLKDGGPYYQLSMEIGEIVASSGFCVMTGGGPGLMEAAAKGAKKVGGLTFGCNIILPMEQEPNPYLDHFATFRYFFIRKLMLNQYAKAFIILPGGFGTLDEFAEIATLIQTKKIKKRPIILVGTSYWKGMMDFFYNTMVPENTISKHDLDEIIFTDDLAHIKKIIGSI